MNERIEYVKPPIWRWEFTGNNVVESESPYNKEVDSLIKNGERIIGVYYCFTVNLPKNVNVRGNQHFLRKGEDLSSLSDEEFLGRCKERGYVGKTYSELKKMEGGTDYYNHAWNFRKHLFDIYFRTRKNKILLISSAIKANPKLAEDLVKLCHGDESDIADVLAVVYDAPRERVMDLLRKPNVKKYLGDTKQPENGGIIDMGRAAEALYEKYKDEIILEKLRKTLRRYSRERLGPMPKEEDFEEVMKDFNEIGD